MRTPTSVGRMLFCPERHEPLHYPHCRGDLMIIAAIEGPAVIVRDTHAPGGLPIGATAFTGAAAGAVPGGSDPQGKSGSAIP
jgi:hypothetical protein